jgi:hypothetical protein
MCISQRAGRVHDIQRYPPGGNGTIDGGVRG